MNARRFTSLARASLRTPVPAQLLEAPGQDKVKSATQEFAVLFETDRQRWLATGPRIFGDIGIVLEIKLCGERHMQRLRNSKMNMSRSGQPGVFLQPRKIWWDWISPWHDGFKLIIPLLITQHHSSQVEVRVFGKVARLIGVIQASAVRLPDFNQRVW